MEPSDSLACLVLPAIICHITMRSLSLNLWWQVKKCLRNGKLFLDFLDGNSVIYQCEKTSSFRRLHQLLGDLFCSFLKG